MNTGHSSYRYSNENPGHDGDKCNTTDELDKETSKAEKSYINKLLNTKLVETQACDIEMLREDPSNPLHSAKTFQELNLFVYILNNLPNS